MSINWDTLSYEMIAAIVGMVTGIIGTVFGLLGLVHNRFLAANEFLSGLHDPTFIQSRRHVYQMHAAKKAFSIDDGQASAVVNFFHKWGLLAQHRYLPMWVFKSGSGPGVIRLYEILLPFIDSMRSKHGDVLYAGGFEWLYKRLKRSPFQTASS